jgi:hypothetical protein
MSMKQQILEAVLRALDTHDADMTDSLLHAIVDEVEKTFTPTRDPGHGHGSNN